MKSYNSCLLVSSKLIFILHIAKCSMHNNCFFAELVLKQEQEEYQREGIEWKNIDYFNNKVRIYNYIKIIIINFIFSK